MQCAPRFQARPLRRALTLGSGIAVLLTLAACAGPSRIQPGSTEAQALEAAGNPTMSCPTADGGKRLIWSGQPYGQFTWAADVSADGRVKQSEQVLTDPSFERLRSGTWTKDEVRCAFGPPAEIGTVGVPGGPSHLVWSYRYKQDTVWNSLMYVYFDGAGIVTRFHPGPDPLYDVNDSEFPS